MQNVELWDTSRRSRSTCRPRWASGASHQRATSCQVRRGRGLRVLCYRNRTRMPSVSANLRGLLILEGNAPPGLVRGARWYRTTEGRFAARFGVYGKNGGLWYRAATSRPSRPWAQAARARASRSRCHVAPCYLQMYTTGLRFSSTFAWLFVIPTWEACYGEITDVRPVGKFPLTTSIRAFRAGQRASGPTS